MGTLGVVGATLCAVSGVSTIVISPSTSNTDLAAVASGKSTASPIGGKSTASPIGGKPRASKLNVTPLQVPSLDRLQIAVSTGEGGGTPGRASVAALVSPRSPDQSSFADAISPSSQDAPAELQHADILRRRRLELISTLMGGHELLPEFRAKYELISDLGVGAFGFVVSARERTTGPNRPREVAVKFISKESVPRTSLLYDDRLGMIPSEIFVLRRLQHPHILAYIESFADAKYAAHRR